MSYDITNYAFLGCPLKDALEKTTWLDGELPLKKVFWGSWLEESQCIVIDSKLETLFEKHSASLTELFPKADTSFAGILKVTVSSHESHYGSPSHLLLAIMLLELGLSLLDYLDPESKVVLDEAFLDAGGFTFIDCEFFDLKYNGQQVDAVATFSQDSLAAIITPLLAVKGLINYTSLMKNSDEGEEIYPLTISISLSKFRPNDASLVKFQVFSKLILNSLLHSREDVYFEGSVGVESTCGRNVHSCGGMEENTPYLVVSDNGDIFSYDDEGWENPLETDPESIEAIAEALFDDPDTSIFQKYTPQFGG